MRHDLGSDIRRGAELGTEVGLVELGADAGLGELVRDLVLELAELGVDGGVDLARDEGAEAAVGAGEDPEDGVDEVDPDGVAHRADARVLVPLVRVVAGHAEEQDGKDAEDDEPEHEEGEVPGEEARRAHEGLRHGEEDGRGGAQGGHEERVDPLGGLGPAGAVVGAHARAVEADDDEGEDELEPAADEAEPGLVEVDGLGYGALAELGGERLELHG